MVFFRLQIGQARSRNSGSCSNEKWKATERVANWTREIIQQIEIGNEAVVQPARQDRTSLGVRGSDIISLLLLNNYSTTPAGPAN